MDIAHTLCPVSTESILSLVDRARCILQTTIFPRVKVHKVPLNSSHAMPWFELERTVCMLNSDSIEVTFDTYSYVCS